MATVETHVPDHVPAERVVDFDLWRYQNGGRDAFAHYARLVDQGVSEIFWTPRNDGHWVFTTYESIREGYGNYELFTSFPTGIPLVSGRPHKLIPNELDPPEHTFYRRLLNPLFAPKPMARMQERIRSLAVELIEPLVAAGECDFASAYALRLPNLMFLYVMGLPEEELPKFLEWEHTSFRSLNTDERKAAQQQIVAYLVDFVAEQAKDPGEGVIGTLLRAKLPDGRSLTQAEVVSIADLMYAAGLDTVANTLSFFWMHLAEHAELRQMVRDDPSVIPDVTLELLRIYAIANLTRRVKNDMTFRGVSMKAGDAVLLPTSLANRDPMAFPDPLKVDMNRDNNALITFGAGPHRCLGSHLARQELNISLEEWFKRIPDFEIAPGEQVEHMLGATLGIYSLPLAW